MGLGDVSDKVIPKPVIVSAGDDQHSITSRYFTPRRCHASHAATGAIGVATAFALPGTVASNGARPAGRDARHRRAAPAGPHRRAGRARWRRRPGRRHAGVVGAHRPQDPAGRSPPARLRLLRPLETRQARRAACRRNGCAGRAVPRPAHHDHRADLGRRRQRRHGPRHRPTARPAPRPDRHRRQPLRRQRFDRQRVRGPSPARRAHPAARLHRHPRDEPRPADPRLRPGHRLRPRSGSSATRPPCWSPRPATR